MTVQQEITIEIAAFVSNFTAVRGGIVPRMPHWISGRFEVLMRYSGDLGISGEVAIGRKVKRAAVSSPGFTIWHIGINHGAETRRASGVIGAIIASAGRYARSALCLIIGTALDAWFSKDEELFREIRRVPGGVTIESGYYLRP